MPTSLRAAASPEIFSGVEERHVRWARAQTPRLCTYEATSVVLALALPDAPYVTDMNAGLCMASRETARRIGSNGASAFGGNTSNDTDGLPAARISDIFILS